MDLLYLQFTKHKGHVTDEMLNDAYGNKCLSFKNLSAAKAYAKENNKKHITKLVDYHPKDVLQTREVDGVSIGTQIFEDKKKPKKHEDGKVTYPVLGKISGAVPKEGATPFTRGYLVS